MNKLKLFWKNLNQLMRLRIIALGTLFVGAFGTSIIALLFGESFPGFLLNFGTELAGALVTFILFDLLIGVTEKLDEAEEKEVEHKQKLIIQMGSRVQSVAVPAVEELRIHGWLTDASLTQKNFREANLEGTQLYEARLERVFLEHANLKEANLHRANLRGAELSRANLDGAFLEDVNLRTANLGYASLKGANLRCAMLEGASLIGADLQDANLVFAIFDTTTVLPDGSNWASDTDMSCFTKSASSV